jgi:hypothetical protein
MAFEVKLGASEPETIQFVLNLPIEGIPEGRKERLLRSVLRDPEGVVRFIGFLLAAEEDAAPGPALLQPAGATADRAARTGSPALFEQLVRALHRSPDRIDAVQRFVDDLKKDPDGKSILPPGFDLIWDPILAARRVQKS